MKDVHNWWSWWEQRKHHVFRAFRPSLNAPRVNLAESGHSSWKNSGLVHLDLLDAARQDVAENLQLQSHLKQYEQGAYSGKGPGKNALSKRNYAEQDKRAQAFSNELMQYIENGENEEEAPTPKEHTTYINESSSHRHDPPRKSAVKTKTAQPAPKAKKRPCNLRKTRSKNFTRVLAIAKNMKSISVKSELVISDHEHQFTLSVASGTTYDVEINQFPSCSCRYCCDKDVCSHVIWLLLNRFKVPESDYRLHQRGFTSLELEKIFASDNALLQMPPKEGSKRGSKWSITKHVLHTKPRCPTCHSEITKGDLKITCDARWMPPHKNKDGRSFTVPRTFHYCLKWECVGADPPEGSTIKEPPSLFAVDPNAKFSEDEWMVITFLDLPLE